MLDWLANHTGMPLADHTLSEATLAPKAVAAPAKTVEAAATPKTLTRRRPPPRPGEDGRQGGRRRGVGADARGEADGGRTRAAAGARRRCRGPK